MNPLPIDLLIFDLDGTLAETRQDLTNAVNYAMKQLDRPQLDLATVTSYVGNGVNKLLERALQEFTPEEFEKARESFHEFYSAHLLDTTQLYPGVREVLEHYSYKKMAVLSNKSHPYTETIVEKLGIKSYFQVVIGSQPGMERKPSPQSIVGILQQLAVAPGRAVIIGDTASDIDAGKAAGIHTCAVSFGFRSAEELRFHQPDFLIREALELKDIFA